MCVCDNYIPGCEYIFYNPFYSGEDFCAVSSSLRKTKVELTFPNIEKNQKNKIKLSTFYFTKQSLQSLCNFYIFINYKIIYSNLQGLEITFVFKHVILLF